MEQRRERRTGFVRAGRIAMVAGVTLVAACADDAGTDREPPLADIRPGAALPNLDSEARARFLLGQSLFERLATPEEGLGPLFNAERCSSCHDHPAVGGGGSVRVVKATRFEGGVCDLLASAGGDNVQQRATPALAAHGVSAEEVPEQANGVASVTSPPLFGLGLLAAVPDSVLARLEDPEDQDSDGISGRRGVTQDGRSGRFGRKAEVHSLEDFVDTALRFELGLTTSAHPIEETINGTPLPAGVDPMADPEIDERGVELLADYIRYLAPPLAEAVSGPLIDTVTAGEAVFASSGCTGCHLPALPVESGFTAGVEARSYTDLLLHDLGPEVADVCGPGAAPSEYRTAPLWGLRFRSELLHDGSAATVEEAVLKHGGEASEARNRFFSLSEADLTALLRFLSAL